MLKPKIIRACTVSQSLAFVKGMIPDLVQKYDVALLSSPGPFWSELGDMCQKVRCIEIEMVRQISPFRDLKSLWKIWRTFRKEKPQMVHSMTPKAGLLCMLAAWLAQVPVRVHTFTGLVFPTATGMTKRILIITDWLTCVCATHIIPEGEGVKRDLLSNAITKKPIKVLGYGNCQGIDLNHYDPMLKYDIVEEERMSNNKSKINQIHHEEIWRNSYNSTIKPVKYNNVVTFISIGRMVRDKGINELIEAFIRLFGEEQNIRLILLGHTEEERDPLCQKTLDAIEKHPNIEAVGYQSDVRPWLMVSNVSILASYREGFPNVVIEAGAMGIPQIVTDINGANEIIIEGKNGTIIPSHNVDALYDAMKRMLSKEYRESLAINAREMVASRYDQHYVRQCLYEFYDSIL
jgi:glycosyltransferase involved in cell wall biosynthesis